MNVRNKSSGLSLLLRSNQAVTQSNLAVAEAIKQQAKAMEELTEGIACLLDQMADDAQQADQPRMLDGSLL
ncbi:hypothetical protein KV708_19210 [Comamonas thiooxydans]|uniref:hypothetical protein n=1 Tax=Comamonas thiooxydans TaxID=363952 RepID=UPI0007108F85|nr:hypothetical protein [Comamonas thiooxydans]